MSNKEYIKAAKHVFNTKEGLVLLASLKQEFVDVKCVKQTPELTYYALGQKELVQELINFVKDPDILQDVESQENIYE